MVSHVFRFSFQWAYLAATYDGVVVRMYVDAKLVAQVLEFILSMLRDANQTDSF